MNIPARRIVITGIAALNPRRGVRTALAALPAICASCGSKSVQNARRKRNIMTNRERLPFGIAGARGAEGSAASGPSGVSEASATH